MSHYIDPTLGGSNHGKRNASNVEGRSTRYSSRPFKLSRPWQPTWRNRTGIDVSTSKLMQFPFFYQYLFLKLTHLFFFQSVSLQKCPLGLCYRGLLCGKEASIPTSFNVLIHLFWYSCRLVVQSNPVLLTPLGPEEVSVLRSILINWVNLNGKYMEWNQKNSL